MLNWVKISRKVALSTFFGVLIAFLSVLSVQASLLPTASFTASQTVVPTGTQVTVNAAVSRDTRGRTGLEYSWDFEHDFRWTSWSRSARATHIFDKTGEYTIRLKVRDSDGYESQTALTIKVRNQTESPDVSFTVSPEIGDESTEFTFTATVVSRIGTPARQLQVRWDFDGDGVWDTNYSYARTVVHTYKKAWVATPRVQARDTNGATRIVRGYENNLDEIGRLRVSETNAPVAAFQNTPVTGLAGAVVYFDATSSLRTTQYRFDFNGDGDFDMRWSKNPKIKYLYDRPGQYSVRLEVRNTAGLKDLTERTVMILAANTKPEAWFTTRNLTNSADARLGVQGDEFRFDASRSRDRDGRTSDLQYRWDFEGDGIWDTSYATTRTATHRYTANGEFQPRLEVRDDYGATAAAKAEIRIVANTPPAAKIKITPEAGVIGTEFRFDAGATVDSQSRSSDLLYRWDFEGDGVFDTEFTRNRVVRHRYSTAGTYRAVVEVRDNAKAVGVSAVAVSVINALLPPAAFTATPDVGVFSTTFTFDASSLEAALPAGVKLWYRWDFDTTGPSDIRFDTGWQTRPIITHRYREVGTYHVRLFIKNAEGEMSDTYREVIVHAASPAFAELQRRGVLRTAGEPDGLLTRQELALLIAKSARLQLPVVRTPEFTDVAVGSPYARAISATTRQGFLAPHDNFAFGPTDTVNRAELTKVVLAALYPQVAVTTEAARFRDVSRDSWYARFAETALQEGLLIIQNNLFRAGEAVTRAEAVQLIATLLERYR